MGLASLSLIILSSIAGIPTMGHPAFGERETGGPIVGRGVGYGLSPAVRDISSSGADEGQGNPIPSRVTPHPPERGDAGPAATGRSSGAIDPLVRQAPLGPATPPPDLRFQGVHNPFACGGCSPPDPNGDVGPNHYVQMVNVTKVAVFNKAGRLLARPFNLGDIFGQEGHCAEDTGDPIVLYDGLADRWLLSQFNFPHHICVAVSRTADPLGRYHRYRFDVRDFPDYFKFGVWPDAYYMSANESSYTAYAFDRSAMLAGEKEPRFVKFTGQTNLLLPADLDGPTGPPAGTPGYFYTFKDEAFHGGHDRIELFSLDVDWRRPRLSTFARVQVFRVAPFVYTVCGFFNFECAQQRGTGQRIDVVSEWPMHRFPYRNFGDHQTLLGNFTVGGGLGEVGAAIRWFELRDTGGGWRLYQEGTHDPGDGHDRFVGSIAMNGAGQIALGYTVTSSRLFPSIRYAVRGAGDELGALRPEATLVDGKGSQTGSDRWGDYTAMAVDPSDDCSFWYTNEFYLRSSPTSWRTAIGAFDVPGC